ncbi:hypothetical protein SKAU_G00204740 [Synaphobranchus kaupii]|uniref:Epidermal growth factor receptor substrate 15-like 1 n=1 Tax=Synaphobranchus kaupii TaxID=118154 RepID=A0A9Q1FGJ5_SYNKA|nr:hypothetical protein SKAU_G00204740 [Synaphobranchus kaupii]
MVWDLSDIDKDGNLDKDEFAVAMHLVYRALEKEPMPSSLPPSLIPPSKRKKAGVTLPGSVPVLPVLPGSVPVLPVLPGSVPVLPGSVPVLPILSASPPPRKDSLRSTPSHGSVSSLNSAGSLSPKTQPQICPGCSKLGGAAGR